MSVQKDMDLRLLGITQDINLLDHIIRLRLIKTLSLMEQELRLKDTVIQSLWQKIVEAK